MNNVYLLYIGKGSSLFGVPARHLTFEEASISGEKRLIDSGLYRLANPKEHKQYIKRSKKETIETEANNE